MIQSISIKDFRCYENLELHGLSRLNIVVGRNATGKTALLEAIFLAAGSTTEMPLRFKGMRGIGKGVKVGLEKKSFESLWNDLFFNFDQKRTISISLVGSLENTRSVTIEYGGEGSLTLPLGEQTLDSALVLPLIFHWRDGNGKLISAEVKLTPNGLILPSSPEAIGVAFFHSSALLEHAAKMRSAVS